MSLITYETAPACGSPSRIPPKPQPEPPPQPDDPYYGRKNFVLEDTEAM